MLYHLWILNDSHMVIYYKNICQNRYLAVDDNLAIGSTLYLCHELHGSIKNEYLQQLNITDDCRYHVHKCREITIIMITANVYVNMSLICKEIHEIYCDYIMRINNPTRIHCQVFDEDIEHILQCLHAPRALAAPGWLR